MRLVTHLHCSQSQLTETVDSGLVEEAVPGLVGLGGPRASGLVIGRNDKIEPGPAEARDR
jgi:hypothetical protein